MSQLNVDDLFTNTRLRLPRFTTTQRNTTFPAPEVGTIIFNTTENFGEYWNGTKWNGFGRDSIPVDVQLTATQFGRDADSPLLVDNLGSLDITANWGYNGYYAFEVPSDGIYRITACGCNGRSEGVFLATPENFGAEIVADVFVAAGGVMIFMAGQYGPRNTPDGRGAGGGGMSAVAYSTNTINSTTSVAQAIPLVVGGGGGGGCWNRTGHDPNRGYGNVKAMNDMMIGRAGQSSGYTAEGHGWAVGFGGRASSAEFRVASWNGGGFFGDGVNGTTIRSGGSNGQGFVNGGQGGLGEGGQGEGGFGGGGGGANNCGYGGGAGGYSGGGTGGYQNGCGGHGGGGGSYYDTANGTLVSAQNVDTRYGYIRIQSEGLY